MSDWSDIIFLNGFWLTNVSIISLVVDSKVLVIFLKNNYIV